MDLLERGVAPGGVGQGYVANKHMAGFPGQLVVLPNGGAMTAAKLARNLANPLQVTVSVGPLPPTPTPGGPTATPPATRHFAFLPFALKR